MTKKEPHNIACIKYRAPWVQGSKLTGSRLIFDIVNTRELVE